MTALSCQGASLAVTSPSAPEFLSRSASASMPSQSCPRLLLPTAHKSDAPLYLDEQPTTPSHPDNQSPAPSPLRFTSVYRRHSSGRRHEGDPHDGTEWVVERRKLRKVTVWVPLRRSDLTSSRQRQCQTAAAAIRDWAPCKGDAWTRLVGAREVCRERWLRYVG